MKKEGVNMYYYAYIDSDNIVTGVYALPTPVAIDGYIEITQDQYENGNLVGKAYDAETNTFYSLPVWIGSTDEVKYKSTNTPLSDKLDSIEDTIASKANTSDLHSHENKDVLDSITSCCSAVYYLLYVEAHKLIRRQQDALKRAALLWR